MARLHRITLERLHTVLAYDPETGIFTWRTRPSYRVRIGDQAGSVSRYSNSREYLQIRVDGQLYQAHQLAWFYVHGVWTDLVDHRDCNGLNNAIGNLREASKASNGWNRGADIDNRSGFKGVSLYRPTNRYLARITVEGRTHNLGYFATAEEAHAAYVRAATKYHGEFIHKSLTNSAA